MQSIQTAIREDLPHDAAYEYAFEMAKLFGPVFGVVPGSPTLAHVASVVAHFDRHFRTVDAFTDRVGRDRPSASELHKSTISFVQGMECAAAVIRGDMLEFCSRLRRYTCEASKAEQYLWRYRGHVFPYTGHDFRMMGVKNSIMKVAPALFADRVGDFTHLAYLEWVVEEVSIAVQLMDDVLDWEEDLANENYTYPLYLAVGVANRPSSEYVREQLFGQRGLVAGPIIGRMIQHLDNAHERIMANGEEMTNAISRARLALSNGRLFLNREAFKSGADSVEAEKLFREQVPPLLAYGNDLESKA